MVADEAASGVNPFQSPQPAPAADAETLRLVSWRDLAIRWERLRLVYNLVMLVAGVGSVAVLGGAQLPLSLLVVGVAGWAVAANVCYLLGPIVQMYLCWFAEPRDGGATRPGELLACSWGLTLLLFISGTGFSVLLTFAAVAHETGLQP